MFLGSPKKENIGLRWRWCLFSEY